MLTEGSGIDVVMVMAMVMVMVMVMFPQLQRPSAKELLKHKFVRNAKKVSCLIDLLERATQDRDFEVDNDDQQ